MRGIIYLHSLQQRRWRRLSHQEWPRPRRCWSWRARAGDMLEWKWVDVWDASWFMMDNTRILLLLLLAAEVHGRSRVEKEEKIHVNMLDDFCLWKRHLRNYIEIICLPAYSEPSGSGLPLHEDNEASKRLYRDEDEIISRSRWDLPSGFSAFWGFQPSSFSRAAAQEAQQQQQQQFPYLLYRERE